MPRSHIWFVQSSRRGSNRAVFVDDPKIEQAPISHAKRQLGTALVKPGDVEMIDRGDVALDLEVRRDGLALLLGEVLVHGEVIVHAPPTGRPLEHVTLGHGLLY